jgi:hypothetical protein
MKTARERVLEHLGVVGRPATESEARALVALLQAYADDRADHLRERSDEYARGRVAGIREVAAWLATRDVLTGDVRCVEQMADRLEGVTRPPNPRPPPAPARERYREPSHCPFIALSCAWLDSLARTLDGG